MEKGGIAGFENENLFGYGIQPLDASNFGVSFALYLQVVMVDLRRRNQYVEL